MKNNTIKKGIDDVKNVKLSVQEKEGMFDRLQMHIKDNPVIEKGTIFTWLSVQVRTYKYAYCGALALALIIIGGQVSYAAESALPGDILYPVKIYVNEPIKSAVAMSPKAKKAVEQKKVIERLGEVEELVKQGKFNNENRSQIEKEVEKSVSNLKKANKNSRDDNKDFEQRVNVQLEKIKEDKRDERQDKEIEKIEDKLGDLIDRKDKDNNGKNKGKGNSRGR